MEGARFLGHGGKGKEMERKKSRFRGLLSIWKSSAVVFEEKVKRGKEEGGRGAEFHLF